jgi:urea transport system permease protein
MSGTDVLNIVVTAVFTAQIALGLTIVFGVLRVINMAHGEFFMLGAYTVSVLASAGVSPWVGIVAAPVLLAVLGMVTEGTIIRPLHGRGDLSTLLATFGLSIVLQQAVQLIFGAGSRSVANPIEGSVDLFGTVYPTYRLVAAGIAVVIMATLAYTLYRSSFGVRVRATMDNTEVAASLGTNTRRMANLAFGLGAALAGLAGALMAPFVGISPTMGLEQTVRSFLVVITGGMGNIAGTFGGGALIGGGETALAIPLNGTLATIGVLLLAILVMLVRPQGLLTLRGVRTS